MENREEIANPENLNFIKKIYKEMGIFIGDSST
jgi:hypothetical protein